MTTLHAVIETHSRDCDGTYTGGYTMTMTEGEKTSDFGDIEFHGRVVAAVVNTYSIMESGRLTVERGETDGGWTRLAWHEQTEEGFRSTSALIEPGDDDDDDEYGNAWHRDHSAEAAGY